MMRFRTTIICVLLAYPVFASPLFGCAGLGSRIERVPLPPGAPKVGEILADLERNDARIETFRAAGTFTLDSPEFKSVRKFRSGRILFRRPASLYAQGNHRITGTTLFKLISVDKEFLIEFPTNSEESYYQVEGEEFEDIPFSVSPSEIVREMFLPEDWTHIRKREVRLVEYDMDRHVATLLIGTRESVRRRIGVGLVNSDDPSWAVMSNELFDEHGETLAVTLSEDYHILEGIHFPARVDAFFPTESTRMIFEMRNIRLNTEIDGERFDIRTRVRELNLDNAQNR